MTSEIEISRGPEDIEPGSKEDVRRRIFRDLVQAAERGLREDFVFEYFVRETGLEEDELRGLLQNPDSGSSPEIDTF